MSEEITFWVNGIVSSRDKQPYIQLSNADKMIAQLSMSQARQIAHDILVMCSRTEADAMIMKFFSELSDGDEQKALHMSAAMMKEFRDFRANLDDEDIKHSHRD